MYPKDIYTTAGGWWWNEPEGWQKSFALASGLMALTCYGIFKFSADNEVRIPIACRLRYRLTIPTITLQF